MSLLKNIKDTLQNAAETAIDASQTLSAQAQIQINLRKLQVEQARKIHELGKATYEWHQAGKLIVSGEVPASIQTLCADLDGIESKMAIENSNLEEVKRLAAQRAAEAKVSPATLDDISHTTSTQLPAAPTTERPTQPLPKSEKD